MLFGQYEFPSSPIKSHPVKHAQAILVLSTSQSLVFSDWILFSIDQKSEEIASSCGAARGFTSSVILPRCPRHAER